jgi:hypothetical protein
VPVRHDREFWRRACREVQRGAEVGEIVQRLGVRPRTLQWWSWKLQRERHAEPAEFLPVVVGEQAARVSTATLEVETNGVRIRIELGTDVGYVAALVTAIRGVC